MFIDVNTYVGHWPFRRLINSTLSELDVIAREYDITHMVVANLNGLFYKDANIANIELDDELKTYSGNTKFLPMAIVNPAYPEWEKDAREMIKKGFLGFELSPLYHGYSLAPEMLYDEYSPIHRAGKVLQLAQELDVPVRICAGFENFRGRSGLDTPKNISGDEMYELLKNYSKAKVVVTSFNPAAAGAQFLKLIKERKNVFFETTQMFLFNQRARDAILNAVSQEQICFGTLSPFNYPEPNLLKVDLCDEIDGNKIKENGFKLFE